MSPFLLGPVRDRAREAGRLWAAQQVADRLLVIAAARRLIAREATTLAGTIPKPEADALVAEILPLAEAAAFLVRNAGRILAPRRAVGRRPPWLFGVRAEIRREARGAVLILGPANYPLFLPGAQALQALAAGNAVCLKPAPGASAPMHAFADILRRAGLPDGVLQVLEEGAGPDASRAGFDFVVLTGSAETGVAVLRAAAESLVPAAIELSGCDACFVLPGADLDLVAAALAYGLRLNAGATCIAPRRVFVPETLAAEVETRLLARLPGPAPIPDGVAGRLTTLLNAAAAAGARIVSRNPAVLTGARPDMALLQQDVFAPWLALVPVPDTEAALAWAEACPFALGVSIFGPPEQARGVAARVRAGSVCINDLIVPTADPRLPFGGRGRSGFGSTRGAEGLLEMTVPKSVSVRSGRFRPHLTAPGPADASRFAAMTKLLHGGWSDRWTAIRSLMRPSVPSAPGDG